MLRKRLECYVQDRGGKGRDRRGECRERGSNVTCRIGVGRVRYHSDKRTGEENVEKEARMLRAG